MLISDFVDYVAHDLQGCPGPLIQRTILDVATAFLSDTQVWTEVQSPIALVDLTSEYDMPAPSGARCIDIKDIYTATAKLRGVTQRELAVELPTWQSAQASCPTWYTRAASWTSFTVYPQPLSPTDSLTVHAVYTLKESATTLPDAIVQRFRDAIEEGVFWRLKSMSKKPWSDPQRAAVHRADYDDKRLAAKVEAQYDKTTGAIYVPPRRFGRP